LLNSQPMGFYAPAQIVRDAREHGVEVCPADINFSQWDCTLEELDSCIAGRASFETAASQPPQDEEIVVRGINNLPHPEERSKSASRRTHNASPPRCVLRLGLRQIKGFAEADAKRLVENRGGGYVDAADLWHRSGLGRAALERLAAADALRSLGLDRRRGLWALKALGDAPLPLFAAASAVIPGRPKGPSPESMNTDDKNLGAADVAQSESLCSWIPGSLATRGPRNDEIEQRDSKPDLPSLQRLAAKNDNETRAAGLLPEMPLGEHVVEDYATLGLTIKRHPLAFLRAELAQEGLVMAADLATLPVDRRVSIAGLVLIRQRPGSANGVVFVTLEDETGIANLIVWPATLERFRRAALGATLLYCRGRLQREESVIHIVAEDLRDWTRRLGTLRDRTGAELPSPNARKSPLALPERIPGYDPREIVIPSRDFR